MRLKISYLCVLTLLISLPASLSAADEAKKGKWEERMSAIYAEIELSPEQEAALKANREAYRKRIKNIYESIDNKRKDIRRELQKPEFDITRVKELHGELKVLKSEKEDYRLEGILAVRSILTPEQFAKFMAIKEQYKTKWNK